MINKNKKILLSVGVAVVLLLFAFSLFKNIAYPLLWNDEASTAMFGRRVIEYGYPKAHDDKNFLYLLNDPNFNVGIREKGDVYVAEGWTQYYLAAVGEFFAQKTENIYTKTTLMRLPFAVAGFLAIIIFGLTFSLFFKGNKKKVFIAFFLFELLSISLILHLREVRYYSLVVLFSAILINVHLRYTILKTISYRKYLWIVPLFIVLLFHTHYPIALAFIISLGLHHLILSYREYRRNLSVLIIQLFKQVAPLFVSLAFIIPSLIYFKTLAVVGSVTTSSSLSFSNYFNNILQSFSFFSKFEFLYLFIFLVIWFILFLIFKKKLMTVEEKNIFKASNFLVLFSFINILILARTVFVFERYILVLQPVLVGLILFYGFICWRMTARTFIKGLQTKRKVFGVFVGIIFIALYMNLLSHMGAINGHIYELKNRYYGPLDVVIPYIQEQYNDPSKLIIATNYEENSYMYYLKSKTIIGFVGNNLEEDMKLEPDIIIPRKFFILSEKDADIFNSFFSKKEYSGINFEIYDYPFNNIPELNFRPTHLYQTKYASNDKEKMFIYLKK